MKIISTLLIVSLLFVPYFVEGGNNMARTNNGNDNDKHIDTATFAVDNML